MAEKTPGISSIIKEPVPSSSSNLPSLVLPPISLPPPRSSDPFSLNASSFSSGPIKQLHLPSTSKVNLPSTSQVPNHHGLLHTKTGNAVYHSTPYFQQPLQNSQQMQYTYLPVTAVRSKSAPNASCNNFPPYTSHRSPGHAIVTDATLKTSLDSPEEYRFSTTNGFGDIEKVEKSFVENSNKYVPHRREVDVHAPAHVNGGRKEVEASSKLKIEATNPFKKIENSSEDLGSKQSTSFGPQNSDFASTSQERLNGKTPRVSDIPQISDINRNQMIKSEKSSSKQLEGKESPTRKKLKIKYPSSIGPSTSKEQFASSESIAETVNTVVSNIKAQTARDKERALITISRSNYMKSSALNLMPQSSQQILPTRKYIMTPAVQLTSYGHLFASPIPPKNLANPTVENEVRMKGNRIVSAIGNLPEEGDSEKILSQPPTLEKRIFSLVPSKELPMRNEPVASTSSSSSSNSPNERPERISPEEEDVNGGDEQAEVDEQPEDEDKIDDGDEYEYEEDADGEEEVVDEENDETSAVAVALRKHKAAKQRRPPEGSLARKNFTAEDIAVLLSKDESPNFYKTEYELYKRRFKNIIFENEYYQDELRSMERKLLRLTREKNFLLDRMIAADDTSVFELSESSGEEEHDETRGGNERDESGEGYDYEDKAEKSKCKEKRKIAEEKDDEDDYLTDNDDEPRVRDDSEEETTSTDASDEGSTSSESSGADFDSWAHDVDKGRDSDDEEEYVHKEEAYENDDEEEDEADEIDATKPSVRRKDREQFSISPEPEEEDDRYGTERTSSDNFTEINEKEGQRASVMECSKNVAPIKEKNDTETRRAAQPDSRSHKHYAMESNPEGFAKNSDSFEKLEEVSTGLKPKKVDELTPTPEKSAPGAHLANSEPTKEEIDAVLQAKKKRRNRRVKEKPPREDPVAIELGCNDPEQVALQIKNAWRRKAAMAAAESTAKAANGFSSQKRQSLLPPESSNCTKFQKETCSIPSQRVLPSTLIKPLLALPNNSTVTAQSNGSATPNPTPSLNTSFSVPSNNVPIRVKVVSSQTQPTRFVRIAPPQHPTYESRPAPSPRFASPLRRVLLAPPQPQPDNVATRFSTPPGFPVRPALAPPSTSTTSQAPISRIAAHDTKNADVGDTNMELP